MKAAAVASIASRGAWSCWISRLIARCSHSGPKRGSHRCSYIGDGAARPAIPETHFTAPASGLIDLPQSRRTTAAERPQQSRARASPLLLCSWNKHLRRRRATPLHAEAMCRRSGADAPSEINARTPRRGSIGCQHAARCVCSRSSIRGSAHHRVAGREVGERCRVRRAHGRLLCAVRCQRADGRREAGRLPCRRRDHLERLSAGVGEKQQLRADLREVGS